MKRLLPVLLLCAACSPSPKQWRIHEGPVSRVVVIFEADGTNTREVIPNETRVELLDPEPDQFDHVRIKVLEGKYQGRSVRVHSADVEELP